MNDQRLDFFLRVLQFAVFFFLFSCQEANEKVKFDKIKWNEQTDPAFPSPYRLKMIADLTTNYTLTGLKYFELIKLLGPPDAKDSSSLSYSVIVDYKQDIDPIHTQDLDFSFSKDSTIESFEYTNGENRIRSESVDWDS